MGVSMESDDSHASSGSNSSESSSNSRAATPEKQIEAEDAPAKPNSEPNSPGRTLSTSSSSSNTSSSSSDAVKSKKKSSSSSSTSGSGSSSSSSSDEEEPEADAAPTTEVAPNPETGSPNKSQQSSFLSSVRSRSNSPQLYNQAAVDLNISHEDLSDVSEIGSEKRAPSKNSDNEENDSDDDDDDGAISNDSLSVAEPEEGKTNGKSPSEERQLPDDKSEREAVTNKGTKNEEKANGVVVAGSAVEAAALDDIVKAHDDDALDFEAEEGECPDICKESDDTSKANETKKTSKADPLNDDEGELDGDGEDEEDAATAAANAKKKDDDELEEGEVSDEDEKRPEETEPKPVCRFYTRGQCTWGMSCRFLHPGVTDKGNYTMFESMVRSVPMQSSSSAARPPAGAYSNHVAAAAGDYHDYRSERPALHHRPAVHHAPSVYAPHHDARGIYVSDVVPVVVENAWERGLRTAKEMMRKANKRKEQDMDFEDKKMNLTLSPDELEKDPYYIKDRASSPSAYSVYSPPDRYGRAGYLPPPYEDVDAYGRMARYRELPPHRMPQYEDDRRLRPAREVIVQRVEAVGRGDEWNDPWMRSKSIGRGGSFERDDRRRRDRRSYTSNSSYSTSNSSQSDSSSESSRSSSPSDHKRRYAGRRIRAHSPNEIPRRPRRSPPSVSPSYKRPAIEKRGAHSPASKRKKLSPVPKKFDKLRRRRSSSSSDSDSSTTSYSDSESGSSSSESSSGSRDTPQKRVRATDKALNERKLIKKPAEQIAKKRSPILIEIKKPSTMVGVSALVSPSNSPKSDKEKENKEKEKDKEKDKDKDGKKTRREELLKQLRAVEDAIAKKRSKLA
ncbi:zinc finger CCCH domain-containing protein 18 [Scaptodrosophila lebanonensis]|uniref:Zinc finger CCCH domain-containing protein 18 n=1 Tax=Drosophila lebanonensis TaxID=7225 RepID=A0A6J2U011_DROLE|nr:zinc finger CCCH domain-containing protein 18 [Scaptodrosophila lebanonensis]XP_030382056.1 zinc finger CCCH domain-containing protein 18 [Scaptodrosophila lebanonensis]